MAQRELTWGDVFEEVTSTKPLTTDEAVNCLFAAFQDMVAELNARVEQKEAA